MSATIAPGASLMDRLGISSSSRTGRGREGRHSPYTRPSKASADDDGPWKHDMYASQNNIEGGTLGARLAAKERPAPSPAESLSLKKALASLNSTSRSSDPLSIRGASGVTVEVRELVQGTTAADVEAIFKRCGTVVVSKLVTPRGSDTETVQIKFKSQSEAQKAIDSFHGQPADGRILQVVMVGGGVSLRPEGETGVISVDGLLDDDSFGGSKMRSDAIIATDARAQVLTDPLSAATRAQANRVADGGRRRGRGGLGRGGRRGGRGAGAGGSGMDIDN